jgi:hypothetical protein
MINIIDPVHHINPKAMGSFNDFKPGLSPDGSKSLNFLEDDTVYVFVDVIANFHHFLLCVLMPSLEVVASVDNKKLHFVLYSRYQKPKADNFDNLLIEMLQEKAINYTAIHEFPHEYINSKNFIAINGPDLDSGIPILYDYFVEKYKFVPKRSNKKIYISRSKYITEEKRIDNEDAIEKLFKDNGFEIVYPEQIESFKEQFELFNSCAIIAGLTGSGLTNLLLMPKNQIFIEIVTKLEITVGDPATDQFFVEEQIHEHYKEFCIYKDHIVISIFNMEKSAENIREKLNKTIRSLKML